MLNRYKLYKHLIFGKQHSILIKEKLFLATKNYKNPMFNKKHRDKSKNLISKALSMSIYMYKVIYDQL